eukprot:766847-Hanusia_phi.AAC.3
MFLKPVFTALEHLTGTWKGRLQNVNHFLIESSSNDIASEQSSSTCCQLSIGNMSMIAVTATAVAAILTGCSQTHLPQAFQPSLLAQSQLRMTGCNSYNQKFLFCSPRRHRNLIESTSQSTRHNFGSDSRFRVRCQKSVALKGAEQASSSESEKKDLELTNNSTVPEKQRLYGATETRWRVSCRTSRRFVDFDVCILQKRTWRRLCEWIARCRGRPR